MEKKKTLIVGAGLLIVIICCVIYIQNQQKNHKYSYELLRVKSSLEQIVLYSENGINSISAGESDAEHDEIMKAVTTLDLSTAEIALLHNKDGSLGRHIFKLADHLNGTYPHLPDDEKLYWLECIRDASEEFLSVLEQTEAISINDFTVAVNEFSSALPTYE